MPPQEARPRRKSTRGAYILLVELSQKHKIRVGALGFLDLPRGRYAYVGSAMSGIEPRVARHARRRKKIHWHVDRLTAAGRVTGAWLVRSETDVECELNRYLKSLEGAREIARGFGSSDCGCSSHLHLVDDQALEAIEARFGPLTPSSALLRFRR